MVTQKIQQKFLHIGKCLGTPMFYTTKSKVLAWADEYLKTNDIDDITYKFITDADLNQVVHTDL